MSRCWRISDAARQQRPRDRRRGSALGAAVRPHSTAGVVSHRGRDYIEHRAPGLLTVLALAGALGVAPGTLVDDLPLDGPAARDEADGR